MDSDLQVVILAAGLATRLRPLTIDTPKTLLPVCNVSMLGRLLTDLRASGIDRATLVLSKLDAAVEQRLAAATPRGLDLRAVRAVPSLIPGTVTSTRGAIDRTKNTLMVVYGDSLLSADFEKLIRFHYEVKKSGGRATILYHRPDDIRVPDANGKTYHGVLSVGKGGLIAQFIEKVEVNKIEPGFDLANAAVFLIEREFLDDALFESARDFSYDVFEVAIQKKVGALYGVSIESGFRYDIGSIDRFYDANMKVLRGEIPAVVPGTEVKPGVRCGEGTEWGSATIIPPVLVGDGVRLGRNSEIGPDAVIGNGCKIGNGALVRQAVLLNNCMIDANARVELAILGAHCTVQKDEILSSFTVTAGCTLVGERAWPEGR